MGKKRNIHFISITPYNTYMFTNVNKRVLYTFLSFVIVFLGTLLAIQYAKGNFRLTNDGLLKGAGLLAANSFPTGAEVFVNGKLVTATDDTLYLEPGRYDIEIQRDGYTPWKKQMEIRAELVSHTNAALFPIAPSLSRLTFSGVHNLVPSPDGQKILYYTASQSAQKKNGLYVLEMGNNLPISFDRGPRQIAEDVPTLELKTAEFIWSPDSTQVMILTPEKEMLLTINETSDLRSLTDISFQRKQILSEWESEIYLKERQYLAEFPPEMIAIATESAKNVYLSPDKKRMLYTATQVVTIPTELSSTALPSPDSTPEERTLVPGTIYVYDREEDKNFKIGSEPPKTTTPGKTLLSTDLFSTQTLNYAASPSAFMRLQATDSAQTVKRFNQYYSSLFAETMQWFPDSRHLFFVQDGAVKIVEYDGSNVLSLYSGPFERNFVYPWPDGSRLLIETSFSPDAPPNLYAIELK
jgi:hypothetical protein